MAEIVFGTADGPTEDGESVQFTLALDTGESHSYTCSVGMFFNLIDLFRQLQYDAQRRRHELGKVTTPVHQPGVVRESNFTQGAILPGLDGLPRLIMVQGDESTVSIRLTKNDLIKLKTRIEDALIRI